MLSEKRLAELGLSITLVGNRVKIVHGIEVNYFTSLEAAQAYVDGYSAGHRDGSNVSSR